MASLLIDYGLFSVYREILYHSILNIFFLTSKKVILRLDL